MTQRSLILAATLRGLGWCFPGGPPPKPHRRRSGDTRQCPIGRRVAIGVAHNRPLRRPRNAVACESGGARSEPDGGAHSDGLGVEGRVSHQRQVRAHKVRSTPHRRVAPKCLIEVCGHATIANIEPSRHRRSRKETPSPTLSNPCLTWGDVVISTTPVGAAVPEWALRDSNPRPQPCEGCALTN